MTQRHWIKEREEKREKEQQENGIEERQQHAKRITCLSLTNNISTNLHHILKEPLCLLLYRQLTQSADHTMPSHTDIQRNTFVHTHRHSSESVKGVTLSYGYVVSVTFLFLREDDKIRIHLSPFLSHTYSHSLFLSVSFTVEDD